MTDIEVISLSSDESSSESLEVVEIESSTILPETSELLKSAPQSSSAAVPLTPPTNLPPTQERVNSDVPPAFSIASSPIIVPSASSAKEQPKQSRVLANDSIIHSSFSFSKEVNKPQEKVLDLVHWLSSDSETNHDVISQYIPKKHTIRKEHIQNQPKSRVNNVVDLQIPSPKDIDQDSDGDIPTLPLRKDPDLDFIQKCKELFTDKPKQGTTETTRPQKKSKKAEPSLDTPQVDGFKYSHKELINANKVTKKKEELFAEMELSIESSVYELFTDTSDNFQCRITSEHYSQPIISWNRHINSRYNLIKDIFIPCPPATITEPVVVLYYTADTFITRLNDKTLTGDVISSKIALDNVRGDEPPHVIIVVEAYDHLLNKIKAYEQRQFKNQVLERMGSPTKQTKRKTPNDIESYPPSKEIEQLVNQIQIELSINIFMVRTRLEAINWLNSFTYTIASSLYDKYERNKDLANIGTVKSGSDAKSTFLQSLQQFNLMTESKADRLYVQYKTMNQVYTTLKAQETLGQDNFGRNIVPPSVDTALHKFFTADDPDDIIT